jgi:hypothetical protein
MPDEVYIVVNPILTLLADLDVEIVNKFGEN